MTLFIGILSSLLIIFLFAAFWKHTAAKFIWIVSGAAIWAFNIVYTEHIDFWFCFVCAFFVVSAAFTLLNVSKKWENEQLLKERQEELDELEKIYYSSVMSIDLEDCRNEEDF